MYWPTGSELCLSAKLICPRTARSLMLDVCLLMPLLLLCSDSDGGVNEVLLEGMGRGSDPSACRRASCEKA